MHSELTRHGRVVPKKLRWKAVLPPAVGGVFLCATFWTAYISAAFFHYDFLGSDHHVMDDGGPYSKTTVYFWTALVGTVLFLGGGFLVARAHLYLVKYGTELTGNLIARGAGSYKGMTKAVVEYHVNGKRYEHSETVSPSLISDLDLGDPVTLYVHPKNPGRALVIWESVRAG